MTIEHKKVLITGNGFDLSFGLPTAYKDFVDAMKVLRGAGDDLSKFALAKLLPEKFAGATATVDLSLLKTTDAQGRTPLQNIWIDFFITQLDKMPKERRWVDFEAEIRVVLNALSKLVELEQAYSKKTGRIALGYLGRRRLDFMVTMLEEKFLEPLLAIGLLKDNIYQFGLVVTNPLKNKKEGRVRRGVFDLGIVDSLNSQLIELCSIFAYFLTQVLEPIYNEKLKKVNKEFFTDFSEVYTFNYTRTFEKLGLSQSVQHLHGDLGTSEASSELSSYGTKVVLGVDHADDFIDLLGTEVLSLTKYFQTLYKGTDASSFVRGKLYGNSQYALEVKHSVSGNGMTQSFAEVGGESFEIVPFHFHVWGHSLDLSDRKYISRIFELMWKKDGTKSDNKITIYYHDEASRASLLRNILDARMLGDAGKEKIEQLVYQGRLTFEPNPSVFKEANTDAKP
jgi:hypothetical protein